MICCDVMIYTLCKGYRKKAASPGAGDTAFLGLWSGQNTAFSNLLLALIEPPISNDP